MIALLVATAAERRGIAIHLHDSRRLIITSSEFPIAAPLYPASNERIRAAIGSAPDRLHILPGAVTSDHESITTNLGRGGGDYSAAIIAAALAAERLEIWAAGGGISTADPYIVPTARAVPHISYGEAAELGYFGARMIYPHAIRPAIEAGIAVSIRNSDDPTQAGTIITPLVPKGTTAGIRAIAGKRPITVITIHSYRMLDAWGFLGRIFALFEQHRLSVDLVTTSEVSVSLTVDTSRDLASIVAELERIGHVDIESDMAVVCLVGAQLWRQSSVAARVFTTLSHIPLRMIGLGSSDTNLSLVVRATDAHNAIRSLHEEFFAG